MTGSGAILLALLALPTPDWSAQRDLPLLTFDTPSDGLFADGVVAGGGLAVEGGGEVRLGALWPGGRWDAVLLDLAGSRGVATFTLVGDGGEPIASAARSSAGMVALPVPAGARPAAVVIDGDARVEAVRAARTSRVWPTRGWRVWRDGLTLHAAGDGWGRSVPGLVAVREVSETRVLAGDWAIYRDGRAMYRGRPAGGGAMSPMTLDADEGRVIRSSPTDADGDGYDEGRGSHRVAAAGDTVQVRLSPSGPVEGAVVEVEDLPAGEVTATLDGRLVETHERLADGRLLVWLAGELRRPVTLRVRVRPVAGVRE